MPLTASIFSANLGLAVIFPLIPRLAAEAGPAGVGWAFSSYATCLVASQIVAGVLADRLGAARVLVGALVCYVAALLGFALVRGLPGIMAVRALEGLAVGAIMPAVMTLVAAGVPTERRGRAIGLVAGLGGIGFMVGPVMGERLARFGLALPFFVAAGVATLSLLAVTWTWRRGMFLDTASAFADEAPGQPLAILRTELGLLKGRLASPAYLALVAPLFAVKVNFASLQAGLPLYGPRALGMSAAAVGGLFVLTAIAYAIAMPLAGKAADRLPIRPLALGVLALLGSLALALAPLESPEAFVAVFSLFALIQSAGYLVSTKYLADALGATAVGRGLGLASAIGDVGMIVGPAALMPLFAWHAPALFWGMMGVAMAAIGFNLIMLRGQRSGVPA